MDVNMLRALLTLICFVLFLGIVAWAWSSGSRARFHDAARVPLDEDDGCVAATRSVRSGEVRK